MWLTRHELGELDGSGQTFLRALVSPFKFLHVISNVFPQCPHLSCSGTQWHTVPLGTCGQAPHHTNSNDGYLKTCFLLGVATVHFFGKGNCHSLGIWGVGKPVSDDQRCHESSRPYVWCGLMFCCITWTSLFSASVVWNERYIEKFQLFAVSKLADVQSSIILQHVRTIPHWGTTACLPACLTN